LRSSCTTIVLEGSVLAELDALASRSRADLLVVGHGHRRALVPRFCRPAAGRLAARTARRVVIAPRGIDPRDPLRRDAAARSDA
jgi:nucleotide-binding universal stress UspA family protein